MEVIMKNLFGWQRVLLQFLKKTFELIKSWGASYVLAFFLGAGLTAIVMVYYLTPQKPVLDGFAYNFENTQGEATFESTSSGFLTIADKKGYIEATGERIEKCDVIKIADEKVYKAITGLDDNIIIPPLAEILIQHGCLEVE